MKLFHIDDDYIEYLRKYEDKIYYNKNKTRPYVGVVLEINSIKYFAPLSSPKPKHKHMKNSIHLRKIKQGKYGVIDLSKMIPVPLSTVTQIDISLISDIHYRRLLQNQYEFILDDEDAILKNASKLYKLLKTSDEKLPDYHKATKSRCCDLPLLENKYLEYKC